VAQIFPHVLLGNVPHVHLSSRAVHDEMTEDFLSHENTLRMMPHGFVAVVRVTWLSIHQTNP